MSLPRGLERPGTLARRRFLAGMGLGFGIFAGRTHGESSKRTVRVVGIVAFAEGATWNDFLQELRERGWVEGRNIVFERRYWEGDRTRLPRLMAELVAHDVDVIFAQGAQVALAAKEATDRIPIVFSVGDAIGRGIVANVARPEGNATGVSAQYVESMAKRVELLKQVSPGISRVAALMATNIGYPPNLFKERVPRGVEIFIVDVTREATLHDSLVLVMIAVARHRVDAVLVGQNWNHLPEFRIEIVEAIARARLPAVFVAREFVEVGGLLAYSTPGNEVSRHVAIYIDKILRGAKPADLPVEQPMGFDLAINLKTAKALGITIPRELLVRADRIVE